MKEVMNYIRELKIEINKSLQVDYEIKADPYDNIARLKICEKIEKFILNNKKWGRKILYILFLT